MVRGVWVAHSLADGCAFLGFFCTGVAPGSALMAMLAATSFVLGAGLVGGTSLSPSVAVDLRLRPREGIVVAGEEVTVEGEDCRAIFYPDRIAVN